MSAFKVVRTADLAQALGYTTTSFRNIHPKMSKELGLPKPFTTGKWDMNKVIAWTHRLQECDGVWEHTKVKAWLDKLSREREWEKSEYRAWCAAFGVEL